jgi:hypothetical protein
MPAGTPIQVRFPDEELNALECAKWAGVSFALTPPACRSSAVSPIGSTRGSMRRSRPSSTASSRTGFGERYKHARHQEQERGNGGGVGRITDRRKHDKSTTWRYWFAHWRLPTAH